MVQFTHRPISITVDNVGSMSTVRDLTTARAFLRMLCEKVLADEPVDLITFSMNGR